jgi:hypothetical protein
MFARVTADASDAEASTRFSETVLPAVGGEAGADFAIAPAGKDGGVTYGGFLPGPEGNVVQIVAR